MRLIKENGLNILKADENKLLKVIGDDYKPQIKDEEGNIIEEEYIPYTTDTVYLGKSIDTIEKAKKIYEEIEKYQRAMRIKKIHKRNSNKAR